MLVIGLTGGIGCGKSTITDLFAELGTPIIDADQVAREVVEPGQPALQEIASLFGQGVLEPNGHLDRARLRTIIFDDEKARRDLEAILHPRILTSIEQQLSRLDCPYVILSIPLLLETGQYGMVHRILVVDCPRDLQIARVSARDGIGLDQIQAILASQCSRQERLAAADEVIDNSGSYLESKSQVLTLHRKYLALSGQILENDQI